MWDLTGYTPVFLGPESDAAKRVATLERQGQSVAVFPVFNHPGWVSIFKKRGELIEGEGFKGRNGILCNGGSAHAIPRKNRRDKPASEL